MLAFKPKSPLAVCSRVLVAGRRRPCPCHPFHVPKKKRSMPPKRKSLLSSKDKEEVFFTSADETHCHDVVVVVRSKDDDDEPTITVKTQDGKVSTARAGRTRLPACPRRTTFPRVLRICACVCHACNDDCRHCQRTNNTATATATATNQPTQWHVTTKALSAEKHPHLCTLF